MGVSGTSSSLGTDYQSLKSDLRNLHEALAHPGEDRQAIKGDAVKVHDDLKDLRTALKGNKSPRAKAIRRNLRGVAGELKDVRGDLKSLHDGAASLTEVKADIQRDFRGAARDVRRIGVDLHKGNQVDTQI